MYGSILFVGILIFAGGIYFFKKPISEAIPKPLPIAELEPSKQADNVPSEPSAPVPSSRIITPERDIGKMSLQETEFPPLMRYGADPIFLKKFYTDPQSGYITEGRESIDFDVGASPESLVEVYVANFTAAGWIFKKMDTPNVAGNSMKTFNFALKKGETRLMLMISSALDTQAQIATDRAKVQFSVFPDANIFYKEIPRMTQLEMPPMPKATIFWKGTVGYVPSNEGGNEYRKKRETHRFSMSGSIANTPDEIIEKLKKEGFSVTERKFAIGASPKNPNTGLNSAPPEPKTPPAVPVPINPPAPTPSAPIVAPPAPAVSGDSTTKVPRASGTPLPSPASPPTGVGSGTTMQDIFDELDGKKKTIVDPMKIRIPDTRRFFVLKGTAAYQIEFSDQLIGVALPTPGKVYITVEIGADAYVSGVDHFPIKDTGFDMIPFVKNSTNKFMSYQDAKIANTQIVTQSGKTILDPIVLSSTESMNTVAEKLSSDMNKLKYTTKRLMENEYEIQLESNTAQESIHITVKSPIPPEYQTLFTGSTIILMNANRN
jgi:hypothetical protein